VLEPPVNRRGSRLTLVGLGVLALLAVVAFASRSGLGHQTRASPSSSYLDYAFTLFLVVFVLAIPVAVYAFLLQSREGAAKRPTFLSRVISSIGLALFFGLLAFAVYQLKQHHSGIFHLQSKVKPAAGALHRKGAKPAPYEPQFESTVLWIVLPLVAAGAAWFWWSWHTRKKRTAVRLAPTMAEDFATSISDAIDDLEAEVDARRAVIAAYARMEGVLARHGLERRPSETPVEYLRRILLGLTSRGDAVATLTSLFEQAKFSRHEIDAEMKQRAIGALREIRDDLRA
jgi:hypothetical protein